MYRDNASSAAFSGEMWPIHPFYPSPRWCSFKGKLSQTGRLIIRASEINCILFPGSRDKSKSWRNPTQSRDPVILKVLPPLAKSDADTDGQLSLYLAS
jgi:hypothetical protein